MRPVALLMSLGLLLSGCTAEQPTTQLADRGKTVAEAKGCFSCHSVDGSQSVAPTWKGLFGSNVELTTGETVVADVAYLRESMLKPSAKTVAGYPEGLMETVIKPNSLTPEEVLALIAYIQSL
ncbi:MAG: cytochrome c [Actinobacteria bacterium]|nr:cytochrome c [Actinomycetota bacterium]